ncbi:Hypothetical protein CINCED_3A022406 [Cinara cedri]|uniref:Uncharacterized protein n=1 Tax=Cinara cedri TaxID=506608 RepID=A0A5E4M6E1_9HEMI|nr:Hypothetical protein CINCED_3A022406 [Cinara cedri]
MRLFLYTLLVSTLAISKTVRTDNPQPSDQTNLELSVSNDQSNSYQNQNSLKADVTNDGKHASLDASSQTVQNSQSKNELHLNIEQSDTDSDPNDSTISNSAMTNENINTLQQQSYNFKENSGTDDLESNNPTGQNFGLISPQPDGASPQILGSGIQTNSPTQGQNIMSLSGTDPNSINNADAYGPTQPRDSSSPQGSPINYNDDNIPTAGGSSNGNTPPSSGGTTSPDSSQIGSGSLPISTSPGGQNGLNPSLFDPNSPNDAGTFGPSQFPDSSSLQGSPNNNNNDNIPPAGGISNGNTPPSSGGPASPDSPQIGSGSLPISTSPGGQNGLNPSLFDPNSPNDAGTFGPSQFPDSSSLQGSPNNNNNDNIPPAGGSSNGNTPPSSGGPSSLDSPQIGSGSLPISTSPGGQNGLNPSLFDPNSPNDAGTFGPSQFPDSSSLQGSPNNNNNDNIPPAGGSSNGNTPPSSGGPASPSYPQFGIGLVPLSYLPSGQNGVNPSLFDPNSINNAGAFGPSQPPDSSSPQGSPNNNNNDNIPPAGGSSNGNTPPSSGGPASPDSPQIGSGSIPISTSPGGQNGLNPSLFDPNSPNDAGSNDAGSFGPSQFPDSSSLQGSPNNNNNDNIPPAGGLSNGNSPPSSEGSSTVTNLYTKSSELSNSEYFNGGVSHSESSQFEESISITSDSTEMETQQYVLNSYSSGKFICDGYGKIIGVVFNHSADSGQGLDTIDLDTNSVIWEDINMLGLDIYQFSGNAGNYVGDKADNAYTSSKNSLGDAANYVGDKADNAYTASKNSLGDAANYVGDKADNAYTSSKNSLGDAANYVGDKAGAVNDASKEAGNSIHSATNDYGHDLYDAGHNFKENAFGSSDGDVTNNV